jgi:hypothetical protein
MVPGLWHIEVGARLLRARRDPNKNFSEDHLAAAEIKNPA